MGGVFLKAQAPRGAGGLVRRASGHTTGGWGSLAFDGPESAGMTVFAHFPQDTNYFSDVPQQAMVNLRVDNLDESPAQLAAAGVRVDPRREDYS
jgi:hypothetical protein